MGQGWRASATGSFCVFTFHLDSIVDSQYCYGVTLKQWMEKNEKTLSEVAAGTGVQAASLSRFLRGRAGLSLESAKAIVEWVREQNAANGWRGGVEYDDLTPSPQGEAAKP